MTKIKDESIIAKNYLDEHVSTLRSEYSKIKSNEALSEEQKTLLIKTLLDDAKIKAKTGEFQTMRKIRDDDMKAIKALIRQRVGDPKKITKEDIEDAVQFFYGSALEKGPVELRNPYPGHQGFSEVWSMLTTNEEKQMLKKNVQITKEGKINFITLGKTFSLFSLEGMKVEDNAGIIDFSQRDELDRHGEPGKKYLLPPKALELIEKSDKKIFRYGGQFEDVLQCLPGGNDKQVKYMYFLKLFGLHLPGTTDLYTHAVINYDTKELKYRDQHSDTAVILSIDKKDVNSITYINRINRFVGRDEHYNEINKPEYSLHSDTTYPYAYPNFLVYENNPIERQE